MGNRPAGGAPGPANWLARCVPWTGS